jgi:hypothetical protein
MTRNNLPVIIAAILAVLIIAVAGIYFVPMAKDVIKELATLTTGGLLAIMRPTSQTPQQ